MFTTETVPTHIKNIMRTLDVHAREELIATVEGLGLGLHDAERPPRLR